MVRRVLAPPLSTSGILGMALTAASVSSLVTWGQEIDPADLPGIEGGWEMVLDDGWKT